MFSCSFCDFKTHKKANLRLHYQRKYKCFEKKNGQFTCGCGFKTTRRRDWQTHSDKCWESTPVVKITPNAHVQKMIKIYNQMWKFQVENGLFYAIEPTGNNCFEIKKFKIDGSLVKVGHIYQSKKMKFSNGDPIYEFYFDCANKCLYLEAGKKYSCFKMVGEKVYPTNEITIYSPGDKRALTKFQKEWV